MLRVGFFLNAESRKKQHNAEGGGKTILLREGKKETQCLGKEK